MPSLQSCCIGRNTAESLQSCTVLHVRAECEPGGMYSCRGQDVMDHIVKEGLGCRLPRLAEACVVKGGCLNANQRTPKYTRTVNVKPPSSLLYWRSEQNYYPPSAHEGSDAAGGDQRSIGPQSLGDFLAAEPLLWQSAQRQEDIASHSSLGDGRHPRRACSSRGRKSGAPL